MILSSFPFAYREVKILLNVDCHFVYPYDLRTQGYTKQQRTFNEMVSTNFKAYSG